MKKELSCKHVKKFPCHVPLDKVRCDEKCRRTLSCGHPCLKKCFEDCSKNECQVMKETKLKCGHTTTFSCHEEREEIVPSCTEPCDKKLTCGHDCTGDCGDKCSEIICQVKVNLSLNCKHTVNFSCRTAMKIFSPNTRDKVLHVIHCRTQECKECSSIKNVINCTHKCNKQLECTHSCVTKCHYPVPCPPCREVCLSECVHSKCYLPCGDVCVSCEKPCEWRCKHLQCTRKCWEPCDRPVCNRLCQLDLECGHTCLGLCGEKCPGLCIVCVPGSGHTSHPLISLGCGHNIQVQILDQIFGKRDISIARCPECHHPIYVTHRYGRTIKTLQLELLQRKRSRTFKLSNKIENELTRMKNSLYSVRPVPPPDEFLNLISSIQKNLSGYQLTKLYTMIDLLKILAGVIYHTQEAWHSFHHYNLINSRTLKFLIETETTRPDDSRDIEYVSNLCLRCELCSLASILRSQELSKEDWETVDVMFDLFFSKKKLEDKNANSYLTDLKGFITKYSIKSPYLVKFNFSLQETISDSEIHGTNSSVNEDAVTPKRAKVEKEVNTSKKTKRAASPDPASQSKPKLAKIEYQDSRPQSGDRKGTLLQEDRKKKVSRWGPERKI